MAQSAVLLEWRAWGCSPWRPAVCLSRWARRGVARGLVLVRLVLGDSSCASNAATPARAGNASRLLRPMPFLRLSLPSRCACWTQSVRPVCPSLRAQDPRPEMQRLASIINGPFVMAGLTHDTRLLRLDPAAVADAVAEPPTDGVPSRARVQRKQPCFVASSALRVHAARSRAHSGL
jgi:hypothetical protein